MPGMPVIVLFALSVVAWVWCWRSRETVFRWIYAALDKRFARKPNLDVGLVFLFAFANVTALSLLVSQANLGPKVGETKPETTLSQVEAAGDSSVSAESPEETAHENRSQEESEAVQPLVDQTSMTLKIFQSLILVAVFAAMILVSRFAYDVQVWQWGLGPVLSLRIWETLRVALVAFILIVPPVLILHAVLSLVANYQHDTLDAFAEMKQAGNWQAIALVFVNTAVLVPILEEFIFRGIIQGFAEQFVAYRNDWMRWALGPLQPSLASWLGLTVAANEARRAPDSKPGKSNEAFWGPIVFSSLLFGLAHSGQGPAPISLYFLAMGLGWIYKKTGNIVVCVLVHMLLNGWTLAWALWN